MSNEINVLFVDDEWCKPENQGNITTKFKNLLNAGSGYRFHYETAKVEFGYNPEPVLKKIASIPELSAVVLDIMFGTTDVRLGLDILDKIRGTYPLLPVFMMTSLEKNISLLEKTMYNGANGFFVKSDLQRFESTLRSYTEQGKDNIYPLWGNSESIKVVRSLIAAAALSESNVLILGESGTGKENVARTIHALSSRNQKLMVGVNVSAIPATLVESELFGHKKGGFTGAREDRDGYIKIADNSTLFLDEIGDLDKLIQVKLLRTIQDGSFYRVGDPAPRQSDFRLICATNKSLLSLIQENLFREDLYYRVNVLEIAIPPLRERKDDIPILAQYHLQKALIKNPGFSAKELSNDALDKLKNYNWPGNIRELEHCIESAHLKSRTDTITADDIDIKVPPTSISLQPQYDNIPTTDWAYLRIKAELELALQLRQELQKEKGARWKAEFMRIMFPRNKTANARAVDNFIKRITEGTWSIPFDKYPDLQELLELFQKE